MQKSEYERHRFGAVAQLGERQNRTLEVIGSIPFSSISPMFAGACIEREMQHDCVSSVFFVFVMSFFGAVAQLGERQNRTLEVIGSIPFSSISRVAFCSALFFWFWLRLLPPFGGQYGSWLRLLPPVRGAIRLRGCAMRALPPVRRQKRAYAQLARVFFACAKYAALFWGDFRRQKRKTAFAWRLPVCARLSLAKSIRRAAVTDKTRNRR